MGGSIFVNKTAVPGDKEPSVDKTILVCPGKFPEPAVNLGIDHSAVDAAGQRRQILGAVPSALQAGVGVIEGAKPAGFGLDVASGGAPRFQ